MVMVEPRVKSAGRSLQERILSVGAGWMTAQYALVHLVAELAAAGGWQGHGAPTCAHWVADALDIELCTAREWMRVGKALSALPHIDAAFDSGLSYSKVRTLTRVATPENERELLELAWDTPAGKLGVVVAALLMGHEDPQETRERQHAARSLSWHTEPDGMIAGTFRFPPVTGRPLTAAIDAFVTRTVPDRTPIGDTSADASVNAWPSIAQQRADALVQLLEGGGSRFVTEVVINVRGDGVTYDEGTPICWADLERVAPGAFIRALLHDAEGRPINASARQRHPTVRQQRVVAARDRCCADCGSTEFLEYDHEPAYNKTRRTVVDEIRFRCRTCHRARHETDGDPRWCRRR